MLLRSFLRCVKVVRSMSTSSSRGSKFAGKVAVVTASTDGYVDLYCMRWYIHEFTGRMQDRICYS